MADIAVFETLEFYEITLGKENADIMYKKYPNLKKLFNLVYKIGRIADYIENERNHLPRDKHKASLPPYLQDFGNDYN